MGAGLFPHLKAGNPETPQPEPKPPTPNPNKHSVEVNALVTVGIPFTERQYLSIWGLILY